MNNAEAWVLQAQEVEELEQIEISCLKSLFNLPIRTPTPAIIYALGILNTGIRIEKKQLLYLHRILNRQDSHWTKLTLNTLKELKLGWYSKIITILNSYELSNDLDVIRNTPITAWKRMVTTAIETKNKNRLLEDCHRKEDGKEIPKTKTKYIVEKLNAHDYKREPLKILKSLTKNEGRTMIISRYSMLECGKNYKGTLSDQCSTCYLHDDEEHRLNVCPRYTDTNFSNHDDRIPFESVFSDVIPTLKEILPRINQVWDLKCGRGSMK